MRLVSIHNCEEGLVLAKPIYDQNSRILLNEGTVLSLGFIHRLKNKNIHYVYVQSEITHDVEINDNIPTHLRFEAATKLNEVIADLAEGKTGKNKAIGRVRLIRDLNNVFDKIMKEMQTSKHLLNLLSHMQFSLDELFEHSVNVSLYSVSIGKHLGLKESELQILGLGALFHDIGKLKETKEWRNHPEVGFEMLRKESEFHLLIAHCAYQHHENVDGSGFPRGIRGSEIHLFAKIISVAEAFDHLTAHKSMLPHEAMEIIVGRCFTRYDSKVVDSFKNAVAIYPIGVTVVLNTGETGVVIAYNKKYPQRPIVRIFKDSQGNKLPIKEFYEINLMESLNIMIVKCDAIIERDMMKSK
ncbi:MAG: HD domain-containing protein [Bacillota bacterium]|nr:HD domain-containing protein [Bacillota bacterium]